MQNQITATMVALLAACLLVHAPRVDARAFAKGVENGIYHQEPAGQERQETATAPAENNAEAEKEYAAGRAAMRQRNAINLRCLVVSLFTA